MYSLKESKEVPGVKTLVRVGYPEHIEPDICICTDMSTSTYVVMNSTVLREALLADKKLTEKLLGLKILDADIKKIVTAKKG